MLQEKRKLWISFYFPLAFAILIWLVKTAEVTFGFSLSFLGVYPREWEGLIGIITYPLVHGDWMHLYSNTVPLLVLGTGIFYFYQKLAFKVIAWIYLGSGILIWIGARPSYHIGASGIIYGLVTFLFVSGIIRKNRSLMTISMIITFLYGSMAWGVLPIEPSISWEGHLYGSFMGFLCAIMYRKHGPEDDKKIEFDDSDLDDENPYWLEGSPPPKTETPPPPTVYNYIYKTKPDNGTNIDD